MAEKGTLEVVGQALGELLAPLADRLETGEDAKQLFAELGLVLPDSFFAQAGFANTLQAGATAAADLPDKVTTLLDAIDAEDLAQIGSASQALYTDVEAVVTAVDAIGTALHGAGAIGPISATDIQTFASELTPRLLNLLAVQYLDRRHRNVLAALTFLGLVEDVPERADVDDPNRPSVMRRTLRPDRLAGLIGNPIDALTARYKWGQPDLDAALLLDAARQMLALVGRLVYVEPDGPGGLPELRARDAIVRPRLDVSPPGLEITVDVALAGGIDVVVPLAPGLSLHATAETGIEASTAISVQPPLDIRVDPPSLPVSGHLGLELVKSSATPGADMVLLGLTGGPRIQVHAIRVSAGVQLDWDVPSGTAHGDVTLGAALEGGKVVITLGGADGFLAAILPKDGLVLDADIGVGWSGNQGLFFRGGVGLAVDVPVDAAIGPVKLSSVHLALGPGNGGLALEASAAVSAKLGPFAMAVDRLGFLALLSFPGTGGNLQFADLNIRFKPPSGIGLSLDAAVVKGGGYLFLDVDKGEYAGVLELTFGPVSIKAIGILTTKLPGGQPGWALLLLVFGEFPAIQLGFGFTLTGLGGIIGLQHGVSIEALQNGLRTGVLDAVLFPRDPVANAPQIINQLRVVFPVTPRALTVGPALQLGWGTPALVRVSLAVILQLDNVLGSGGGDVEFTRVVLLGQLRVDIPPLEDAGDDVPELIKIVVDVVGAYDSRQKELSVDARLRDSHVALVPVTGSMALRANFGDHPRFILAVGGFHPRFTDLPPGIPAQDRVGISLRYGIVTVDINGYLAVTSNTFQVGAAASIVAAGGGLRAEAHLSFDALFVFEPVFHFEIDFRVGASIRYKSVSLASADLRGTLSGPGRWRAVGNAKIKILFVHVGVGFSVEWGDAPATPMPSIAVGAQLVAALSSPANWVAQLPAGGDMLVTLRRVTANGDVLAHPLGQLTVSQKVVPLQVDITRVGDARPSDGKRFDISSVEVGGRTVTPTFRKEHFARAQYLDLTEEQKLSTPSFEEFPAGVAMSAAEFRVPSGDLAFMPEFETVSLGEPTARFRHLLSLELLVAQADFGAAAKSALRQKETLLGDQNLRVEVKAASYAVADLRTMGSVVTLAEDLVTSFSFADQAASAHPGAAQVVEAIELESLS